MQKCGPSWDSYKTGGGAEDPLVSGVVTVRKGVHVEDPTENNEMLTIIVYVRDKLESVPI